MDDDVRARSQLDAELRALRADNERQRALTLEAHERALALAKRCDALEAEREKLKRRASRYRFWPFDRAST